MPLSIYNSGWRAAKNVYVRANNAWQNVKQVYVYANGGWRQVFTATKPAVRINIYNPSGDINLQTNSSTQLLARVEDEDGNIVSGVRSITWSESGPGQLDNGSPPTQTTSGGLTSVTYSVQNNSGENIITLQSPGLTQDSVKITVSAPSGLIPSLSTLRFNEGYYLFHFNPNSNWNYSVLINPQNSNQFIGNIYTLQSIIRIPPNNTSAPFASTTAQSSTVECTQGFWNFQPVVQTTVSSSRSGFPSESSTVVNSPTGQVSFLYQWQYSTDGVNWINWSSPMTSGSKVKGIDYNNNIKGNKLRCQVTATRSGGSGGGNPISTVVFSNNISPAP